MGQCPWDGQHDTHQHDNHRKDDSTLRVIGQSVYDLGTGKDVEADKNDVVGEQHESGKDVGNFALSKGVVSKITY